MNYVLVLAYLAAVIAVATWVVKLFFSLNNQTTSATADVTQKAIELDGIEKQLARLELKARAKSYTHEDADQYAQLIQRRNELEPRQVATPSPNPRRAYRYRYVAR